MWHELFLFPLLFLCFLGLTGADEKSFELVKMYDTTSGLFQTRPQLVAVSVSDSELKEISRSVLMAEHWLRTNVLAHYPSTKITTIITGNTVLCSKHQEHNLGLVLPSLKNMFYSLTRWGLEKDIKISVSVSNDCFSHPNSDIYRNDLAQRVIKPLLEFIHSVNSTFTVDLPSNVSPLIEPIKKLGFLGFSKVNVKSFWNSKERSVRKPMTRKLSFFVSEFSDPFPPRPTPLPETAQSPISSPVGYPIPVSKHAHSPLSQLASPPPFSLPFAPESPPFGFPASPPFGFTLPPCSPVGAGGPAPDIGTVQKLWCVAKPSVPAETLQEAMDYACGEGGGVCDEIQPNGNCYYPDTIVAHASFAFNSYWQKNKRSGGNCDFGGTAMIINADPSFLHCRFVLA